jgi:hypothetical protein
MRFITAMAISLCMVPGLLADQVTLSSIGFSGLEHLDKYALVQGLVYRKGNSIILDREKLNKRLSGHPMVISHDMDVEKGRMTIRVKERSVVMRVLLHRGDDSLTFEVDDRYRVIAMRRLYSRNTPLVVLSQRGEQSVSRRLKGIFTIIHALRSRYPEMYGELAEIRLMEHDRVTCRLRNRETRYTCEMSYRDFIRLTWLAGYLDSREKTAGKAVIDKDMAILNLRGDR